MRNGEWFGRAALATIFLLNGLGVVDQTQAAQELLAHGAPGSLVPFLVIAGRVLQLVAGAALVLGWHERVGAVLLARLQGLVEVVNVLVDPALGVPPHEPVEDPA